MARSKSLSNFGRSMTQTKSGVISTRDFFKGVHFTKDVVPCKDDEEHKLRVFNRENTPWVSSSKAIHSVFAPVKD